MPSAAREAAVLDALPANVALLSRSGHIVFVNRGWRDFAEQNGFSGHEAGLRTNYLWLCEAADDPAAREIGRALREILAGRRQRFEHEYPCHGPRERRWYRCLGAGVGGRARDGAIVLHVDVTLQHEAEEERRSLDIRHRHAAKMEALGTFAGGIAHDFNNILFALAGFLDRASRRVAKDVETAKLLASARQAVEQAGGIVGQILAFARGQEARRERVALVRAIGRGIGFLAAGLPRRIALEQHLADVGEAVADPVQLQQVLLNLGANAVDAIGAGRGRIEVTLAKISPASLPAGLPRRPHARLEFRDDGAGFAPELRERIFEPFFTTKEGHGIGLGLAVVHGIVAAHGGRIEAEGAPGKGARFTLYLPLARALKKKAAAPT